VYDSGIPEWFYWFVIAVLSGIIVWLVWVIWQLNRPKPKKHHRTGLSLTAK
jgi:hypothetical protein